MAYNPNKKFKPPRYTSLEDPEECPSEDSESVVSEEEDLMLVLDDLLELLREFRKEFEELKTLLKQNKYQQSSAGAASTHLGQLYL